MSGMHLLFTLKFAYPHFTKREIGCLKLFCRILSASFAHSSCSWKVKRGKHWFSLGGTRCSMVTQDTTVACWKLSVARWDHLLSTYASTYQSAYVGVKNVSFSENVAYVLTEWSKNKASISYLNLNFWMIFLPLHLAHPI